MRIKCPHCGERSLQEFIYHGDASVQRPRDGGTAPTQEWTDYVYFRENPNGAHDELWYHAAGCHAWLVVSRHLRSHKILAVKSAHECAMRRVL